MKHIGPYSRWSLGVIIVIIVYLVSVIYFWPFTVDDAYISARYAWNAAYGNGLTFNPGERVMGYTNLLLVLLEALVYRLGGDGILWTKLIGTMAGVGVLILIARLPRLAQPGVPKSAGVIAASFLAIHPCLALSSIMGLESSLFTLLVLASMNTFLALTRSRVRATWGEVLLALLLFLATLTRPEGLAVAFVLATMQLLRSLIDKESLGAISAKATWVLIYALLLLPALFLLHRYYGSPIPNTFYAKTASDLLSWRKYQSGLEYLAAYVSATGGYLLIVLSCWPIVSSKLTYGVTVLGALLGFYLAYIIYAGGDWIPGFRFLLPTLPYFYAIVSIGMVMAWRGLQFSLIHLSSLSRSLLSVVILAAIFAPSFQYYEVLHRHVMERAVGYEIAHYNMASWLKSNAAPDATVALMDVGIIGFVSDLYIIDFAGLVNREVAQLMHRDVGALSSAPDTAESIAKFVLDSSPDYIVLAHVTPLSQPFAGWSHDKAIYTSPKFQSTYTHLFTRRHTDTYYLSLYQRK